MSKVKLGQVAHEHKGKASETDSGCLPIVGLEHLSSGDIDLLGFDEPGETTFTKTFDEGHVLFGRRRAYLRKASLATFRGICSGDIIVIETDEEKLSPRLLPFIIQSDRLFDYAVENSAGSLSPRVKWQRLAEYEFTLPSLADQEKLADVLWAAQETKRKYRELLAACDDIVKSRFVEMFGEGQFPSILLGDGVLEMHMGPFGSALKNDCFCDREEASCVVYEQKHAIHKSFNEFRYVGEKKHEQLKRFEVGPGDFLVSCRGTIGKVSRIPDGCPRGVIHPSMMMVRIDEGVFNPSYFSQLFSNLMDTMESQAKGNCVKMAVKAAELKKMPVILPPINVQEGYCAFVSQVDKSRVALQQALDDLNAMMTAILNEELSA